MEFSEKNKKINYIAIGDSIGESLTFNHLFGIAGYLDKKTKIIHGISYPSYLARSYQQLGLQIEEFENFCLSGSTTNEWLYFLGDRNKKYEEFSEFIENNIEKKFKNLKEGGENRLKRQFKNFGKTNISDFNYLKKNIANANLITINLGANDILRSIPITEYFQSIMIEDKNKINEIFNNATNKINKLKENLQKIVNLIKNINTQDAKIIFIGYLKPWNRINNLIVESSKDSRILDLYIKLNETLKYICKKNNINYINYFNDDLWTKESQTLTKFFFDIHPSVEGYKKIAQQIFLKTTLSSDFFYNENGIKIKELFPEFNDKYLESDKNYFSCILEKKFLFQNLKQIINIAINLSLIKDKNILEYRKYRKTTNDYYNYFSIFVDSYGFDVNKTFVFVNLFLLKKLKINKIKEIKEVNKIIENNNFKDGIKKVFINEKFVDELIHNFNNFFRDSGNFSDLNTLFKKLLDQNHYFFNFFKNLISQINNKENEKIMILFKNYLSKLIQLYLSQKENIEFLTTKIFFEISKINSDAIISKKLLIQISELFFSEENNEIIAKEFISSFLTSIMKRTKSTNLFDFLLEVGEIVIIKLFEKKIIKKIIDKNRDIFSMNISTIIKQMFYLENLNNFDEQKMFEFCNVMIEIILKSKKLLLIFLKTIPYIIDIHKDSVTKIFLMKDEIINSTVEEITKINKKQTQIIFDFLNILFAKSNFNKGLIYKEIRKITPPKDFIKNNGSLSFYQLLRIMHKKFSSMQIFISFIFQTLYDNYLENKNKGIKDEENENYILLVRVIKTSVLIGYLSFQKNVKTKIFWNNNKGLKINTISIVNIIYSNFMNKSRSKDKKELIEKIFGIIVNETDLKSITEKNYKKNHFIYTVYSIDSHPEWKFSKGKNDKTKLEAILESIKNGEL